ncbi:MAG: DUF5719 family protein [Ilumatobacteraceae bacterium]
MRRIPALVLTLLAIIAAVIVDRSRPDDDAVATPFASERETWMPAVSQGPGAVNWYCPGVPADGDDSGGGVVIANTTNAVLTGRYEVLTPDGAVESEVIDLPAYERLEIDVGEIADAPYATVVAELATNGAVVEQRAVDAEGDHVAPCATQTSDRWYLADGFTLDDSSDELVITNPYDSDAVASLSLVTDQGALTPSAFQGFPVPARSVLAVDIAELGVQDEAIAGVELTATTGQVVLGRAQRFEGDKRGGFTMTLAAPTLAGQWWFTVGDVAEGVVEEYRILNPGDADVAVTASALGAAPTGEVAAPTEIVAAAGRVTTFDVADTDGLAEGPHSMVFSTVDLPGVVVERVLTRTGTLGTATSVSLGGLARPDGFVANNWYVGTSPEGATDEALVLYNTVSADANVEIRSMTEAGFLPILGLDRIRIPPNGRIAIDLDERRALGRTLLVSSTRQIFVERQIPRDGPLGGTTTAWAIPLDA